MFQGIAVKAMRPGCLLLLPAPSKLPPHLLGGLIARVRTLTLTAYNMPVLAHNFNEGSGFLLSVPSLLMSLVTGVGMFFLAKH